MKGRTILHYEIVEKIGEGGMGQVYLAEDTRLKRKVAIKFLPNYIANDEESRQRFKIEAQAAAKLNHPNITQIFAIEESGEDIFIVMEYVDGLELRDLIKSGELSQEEKKRIALQIARALKAAHEKDIMHRDIKSANIMLDDNGDVKIMDFGLARIRGTEHITRDQATLGTAAYMSPEQLQGSQVDEHTDIWSYGVVLYALFAGQLPFDEPYEQALIYAILDEEPPPIREAATGVPEYIAAIIEGCMQKDPDQRISTMADIVEALESEHTKAVAKSYQHENDGLISRVRELTNSRMIYVYAVIPVIVLLILILSTGDLFRSGGVPEQIKLAVLPPNNISKDPSYDVIGNGLMETLTSSFKNLEDSDIAGSLWVLPSSDIRQYGVRSVSDAKNKLNASLVIESSIQPYGEDSTRLTVNLYNAEEQKQLDADIITVQKGREATLHERTIRAVTSMLRIEMNPQVFEQITQGTTRDPEARTFYLSGIGYLAEYQNEGKLDLAIQQFEKAIRQDSSYALAYAGLGESYWRKYELTRNTDYVSDARNALDRALLINNNLGHVRITMGIVYRGTGEYEKALKQFKAAIQTNSRNDAAYRELGRTYAAMGNFEEAIDSYNKSIEIKPEYWAGYNQLGVVYWRSNSYQKAKEQFERAVELAPDNYRALLNLGGVHNQLENYDKAIDYYERSMQLRPNPSAASNLGFAYYQQGMYENAITNFRIAINQFNSRDHRILGNLASAYDITGNDELAVKYYKEAIEAVERILNVNPNSVQAQVALGAFSAELGDSARAVQYLEKAISQESAGNQIIFAAATAYEVLGNRMKALELLQRAAKDGYAVSTMKREPDLRELIKDPRFEKMVEMSD
ncbi:MAG: protein kinase [Balneolaceae bacterium]|nr:protein kinase [Balneolaceae bacterium]